MYELIHELTNDLKECSGQYSVLIKINIVTGNLKLCKIYLKELFFQNVLVSIDLL